MRELPTYHPLIPPQPRLPPPSQQSQPIPAMNSSSKINDDDDYRPQSPDLSDYTPQSPNFSAFATTYQPTSPVIPHYPQQYEQFQRQQDQQYPQQHIDTVNLVAAHRASYDQSPYFTPSQPHFPPSSLPPVQQQSHIHSQEPVQMPRTRRQIRPKVEDVDQWTPESEEATHGSQRKKLRKAVAVDEHPPAQASSAVAGIPADIDVRTKFPVARIKRIMQADEEVGKVAQVTPIAVSKALEIFMIQLVTKSADEARERSSKRVTAAHLKQAVMKDQMFDFLEETIAKVQDPNAKRDENGDGDGDEGGKKRKGGTRKKSTKPENDDF